MEDETLTSKPLMPTSEDDDPNHDAPDQSMADLPHHSPTTPPSDSDSDSDSGSGSNSEDDEAQDKLQLQTLENDLSANPSNYDAHVQVLLAPFSYVLVWLKGKSLKKEKRKVK